MLKRENKKLKIEKKYFIICLKDFISRHRNNVKILYFILAFYVKVSIS